MQTTFYYYGEFSLLRASSAYNKTTDTKLQNLLELRITIRNINITKDTIDVFARESGMQVKMNVGVGVSMKVCRCVSAVSLRVCHCVCVCTGIHCVL